MKRPDARAQCILLLAFAAFAVYANSLANGFALDDVYIIQGNARVKDLGNLRNILLTPYWPTFGTELGLWRPLAILMYALQWAIGDGEAWIFHSVNVALHVTTTAFSFLLLERLIDRRAAFVGALIFAVHPVHTEAVANMVGQAELIAAVASVAACYVFASRPEGVAVSWRRRFVLTVLFAIAILAKENAVVLPALLVIGDAAQQRFTWSWKSVVAYSDAVIMPMLMLALLLGLYLIFRFEVLSGALTGTDAGPTLPFLQGDDRVINALRAFPEFLRLLFFPEDLISDYSPGVVLPVTSLTLMVIVGALLLFGLAALALLTPRVPAIGFPAAWFLVSIITVSNLFFPIGVLIAERTLYLPSFAVAAVVAYAWTHVLPRASDPARRAAPIILGIIVLTLAAATWVRNPDWKDTVAVQSGLIRDHPENYRAQWVQAATAAAVGDNRRALGHYQLAYRIYRSDSQFLSEFGHFMLSRNQIAQGVDLLEQAFALNNYVPRTSTLLAYAYVSARRYADALRMVEVAKYAGAYHVSTLPIRAHALEGLGDRNGAIASWRALMDLPGGRSWKNWGFLARALAVGGYGSEALNAADSAAATGGADSVAVATIARLRDAVRSGCYNTLPPGANAPECDPLGDYFLIPVSVQIANTLQNARGGTPGSGVSTAADTAQSAKRQ